MSVNTVYMCVAVRTYMFSKCCCEVLCSIQLNHERNHDCFHLRLCGDTLKHDVVLTEREHGPSIMCRMVHLVSHAVPQNNQLINR